MRNKEEGFHVYEYAIFAGVTVLTFALCVSMGSVSVPIREFHF